VPATLAQDAAVLAAGDYAQMRLVLERIHNDMHGFVNMGGAHISFRDPFVFLLHSNVDRLFARWQTDPDHPERLEPDQVYGTESDRDVLVNGIIQNVNHQVEPWSTGRGTFTNIRPWFAPENQGEPHTYKLSALVSPPAYDTNHADPVGAPILVGFEITPAHLVGFPDDTVGVVTLSGRVSTPPGVEILLSSSRANSVHVPRSVRVSPGRRTAEFVVFSGSAFGPAEISATYGGVTMKKSVAHTVHA
jgi:hypothetical protein